MRETIPSTQIEQIADLVDMNVDYVPHAPCPAQRLEHTKGVADVRATFRVLDTVPEALQIGLFAKPGTYEAIIRFSNAAQMDDSKRDTHGMAIKVYDVPMEDAPRDADGRRAQDFIMIDAPIFPTGDLTLFIPFNSVFLASLQSFAGKLQLVGFMLRHFRFALRALRVMMHKAVCPLASYYWSTTPYALGNRVVKYKVTPMPSAGLPPPVNGPDGRRDALQRALNQGPGRFGFGLILQKDATRQPIEDPTINWEKAGSECFEVAEIEIPADQDVGAPEDLENRLAFNPATAAAAHFPLGAINRARVAVYRATSRARQAEAAKRSD